MLPFPVQRMLAPPHHLLRGCEKDADVVAVGREFVAVVPRPPPPLVLVDDAMTLHTALRVLHTKLAALLPLPGELRLARLVCKEYTQTVVVRCWRVVRRSGPSNNGDPSCVCLSKQNTVPYSLVWVFGWTMFAILKDKTSVSFANAPSRTNQNDNFFQGFVLGLLWVPNCARARVFFLRVRLARTDLIRCKE